MEDVYFKELAAFAAFQNHLKTELELDAAALNWGPLAVTEQAGVHAVGTCSASAAMLYLSAAGSVCGKTTPSHEEFALAFHIADATWSAQWITTATGLPIAPAFKKYSPPCTFGLDHCRLTISFSALESGCVGLC